MEGQIVKISSDLYFVNAMDTIYPCKCRGIFRKEHITPVVGDYVFFDEAKNIIEKILPRKNVLDRPKVSNIDQAILVTSLKEPDFSLHLLDRFLVLCEVNHILPIICVTKADLLKEEELKEDQEILKYYEELGYSVIWNTDLSSLKEILKEKTSVFTGQTGAGKSTLLNRLNPEWNLQTGEISRALGRGKHTTRVVELFPFLGGKVMDTPGFSLLSLEKYSKEQIRNAFVEFLKYPCPFPDCSHTKETDCVIKEKVLNKEIRKSRYLHYLQFIGGEEYES